MTLFVTVLHVLVCIFLIVVVLLQRGKGAEVGAMFGGGGGSTMFGARGAGNFLTRLTTASAAIFMVTSLVLAFTAQQRADSTLFEEVPAEAEAESPFAEPDSAAEPGSESPFAEVPQADAAPAQAEAPAAAEETAPGLAPGGEEAPKE